MSVNWMKEFEKISIPYAHDFVSKKYSERRLQNINKTFDEYYKILDKKNVQKVKFAEKIEIY